MSSSTVHRFSLREIKGDLFGCPKTSSVAHCVSKNLRMGAGIAPLVVKNRGGRGTLHNQNLQVGDVGIVQFNGTFTYHLVTKDMHYDKPTLLSLEESLMNMKEHMISNKVTELSIPRIGSGLDKLQWKDVLELIYKVFQETDITITVYYL